MKITKILAMAFIGILCACSEDESFNPEEVCPASGRGTFTDERDGQTYRYITIGNKIWMDQNLNYATETSLCYDELQSNCDIYGRLYSIFYMNTFEEGYLHFNEAVIDSLCPKGWKIPTIEDWKKIVKEMDGTNNFKSGLCMDVSLYSGEAGFVNDLRTGGIEHYSFRELGRFRQWITESIHEKGGMSAFNIDVTGIKDNSRNFTGFSSLRCIKVQ